MIAIPSYKKRTKSKDIRDRSIPELIYLPLNAYKGNLTPLVSKGDHVLKYQLIAQSEGIFSSCIHSPVSGIAKDTVIINNKEHLIIENDFEENQLPLTSLELNEILALPTPLIIQKIKEAGIEGSGGAQFPTHLKYSIGQHKIATLIINGVECEPYLTADFVVMKNYTDQVVKAIKVVQQLLNAKDVIIGIEQQNKELRALLKKAFALNQLKATIHILPNTYPQGGELQLIKSVTGKEIPKGSIPAQHGVIVSNVGTIHAIYNALFKGIPYVERMVTFFETNSNQGANYKLKIGTPVSHVLNNGSIKSDNDKLILGGPMMGKQVIDERQPILKGSGGLLYLQEPKNKENNCIACGYCSDVCPQRLLPLEFARNYIDKNTTKLAAYNLMDCIECGACSYVCPSDVPLMWSIKIGKEELLKLV